MRGGNRNSIKRDYIIYMELENVVKEMNDYIDAIIVEGLRDKEAMREIGFSKEIITCSGSGFSNPELIEYVRSRYINKRITILTDYDRNGRMFNKELERRLEKEGVKVEKVYRKKIGRILRERGVKCIEAVSALKKRI
ncbi:MAG: toprim domain-containing protein [Candidatus Methanospirareceae archaeon]